LTCTIYSAENDIDYNHSQVTPITLEPSMYSSAAYSINISDIGG
jgi:hypothetical protein